MKVKPILFNTEMVRAILDGRKTMTRRVVKPQPPVGATVIRRATDMWMWKLLDFDKDMMPPYQPGDILYVRETWAKFDRTAFDNYLLYPSGGVWTAYKADGELRYNGGESIEKLSGSEKFRWKPSIHMPKEAARIWLKVTDVRVERLQDIDDEGAKAEGANYRNGKNVTFEEKMRRTAIERFAEIWNSTIKNKELQLYSWDANPYVWVIEFERCEKPESEE